MLTPQEVSGKAFPKSSFGSSGYNMAAVDEFLDTLTEDYTSLYKENATLKNKLKVLAEKIEEYRATEDAMRSTLLSAQRMAAKMVKDAEDEKERMLTQAQEEADAKIAELDGLTRQAEKRLAAGRQDLSAFIARSRELCLQHAEFLKSLPEMQVEDETAAAPEFPSLEEPAQEAETPVDEPEAAAEAEEEPPAEEPAQEAEEESKEAKPDPAVLAADTTVFPSDFKLSLDQLKFGRNYNGGQN
ncbi:MAG: DivIVA domain-containing protein [Ruminococcaceae bacterium]|jgi:cell division initiation protein|nr:DivIVA domain-containing protein [Oscillospiraceae bacterium]